MGAAVGTGTGAVIGHEIGSTAGGAIIGAATGVVVGGVVGDQKREVTDPTLRIQSQILQKQESTIERQQREVKEIELQERSNERLRRFE